MHRLRIACLQFALLLHVDVHSTQPTLTFSQTYEVAVRSDASLALLQQSGRVQLSELSSDQEAATSPSASDSSKSATQQADFTQVGVLFTYDEDAAVAPGTMGNLSIQIARRWANRHGYTLFTEKGVTDRAPQWLKIRAIQKYLPQVELLIFMDLDVFIMDVTRNAKDLFPLHRGAASCSATPVPQDADLTPEGLEEGERDILFWAGEAGSDHFDSGVKKMFNFALNLNDGLVAFRNHPRSFSFLQAVWEEGNGSLGWRFPHEMKAMHNVLLRTGSLLSRTCILQGPATRVNNFLKHASCLQLRQKQVRAGSPIQGTDAQL